MILYMSNILVIDMYGNYLVQFMLQIRNDEFDEELLKEFKPNLLSLCMQKYSSNAIEKVNYFILKIILFSF